MTDKAPNKDVPPVASPGGARAADEAIARARGKGSGSRSSRGSVPPVEPDPPAEESQEIPRKLTPQWKLLREGVLEIYTGAQMVAFFADPFTAELIAQNKERCTDAWIELARQDKRVERLLRRVTMGAGYGAVFAAHLPIILPVMMRHGILPGGALFNGAPFNAAYGNGQQEPPSYPQDGEFPGTVNFGGNGGTGGGIS